MEEDEPLENSNNMTFNETIKPDSVDLSKKVEVAFHNILYVRGVYPSDLFESCKKYDVPIFRSRHVLLTSYISGVVSQVVEEISKGFVNKLILAIQDATTPPYEPLEHFVFDFQYLVDPITNFEDESDRDIRPMTGVGTLADAHVHLRAFLMKINQCNKQITELPQRGSLTWTTFLELNDPTKEPVSESTKKSDLPPQWVPASDPIALKAQVQKSIKIQDFASSSRTTLTREPKKRLIPFKSEGLGMIQLQMFVIEHPQKASLLQEQQATQPHNDTWYLWNPDGVRPKKDDWLRTEEIEFNPTELT
ncbi:uncharacterized protein MELLADRAFT_87700 [Melampsora larici-populina 98AG31]|uniref:HORMA domain-containing protein n=1 Tax=Melampsora larici-populina (strain 98AG31 / pathotype 3-4-7) TaxID=747676 RepID=F4RPD3_MELLP|nr:uncharacterized protein MELLADRAFT_87700 [Melampsora larici-populina 98AG31]EGG05869.1 hypothetical protein MELLADRAFT_87700 [Melampsora larici-populina 98AG31]